jgi:hypothetical protein
MRLGRVAPFLIALVAAGVLGLTATAARRQVLLGVLGDPARFQQQTGQISDTRLLIVGWGQGATYGSPFAQLLQTMGPVPMLGLSTGLQHGGEITPKQIALGSGDTYLVAVNHALHDFGKRIFLRPYAEMNGHWNPYSAYNTNGTQRDSSHTTALFRAAFARTYLIAHGGPRVASVLRSLGQPPVRGTLFANTNVQVIWNPQGTGSPDVPGNSAAAYYPGDSYVDVVGDDLYDIGFRADWPDAEALYQAHPGKPFAFPEWAPWGIDDPGFVARMSSFVKAHDRMILVSYYSGLPGSVFDLARKPRSLATYRKVIAPLNR